MSELSVLWHSLAAFAVRRYVIDGAILKRMNFISAELALIRFVVKLFSEAVFKKPGLHYGAVYDRINKGPELGPANLGLRSAAGAF